MQTVKCDKIWISYGIERASPSCHASPIVHQHARWSIRLSKLDFTFTIILWQCTFLGLFVFLAKTPCIDNVKVFYTITQIQTDMYDKFVNFYNDLIKVKAFLLISGVDATVFHFTNMGTNLLWKADRRK